MQLIPLDKIHISPQRQRQEYSAESLMDLANSIADTGLLQLPVVRKTGDDSWQLVVGGRRIRAIRDFIWLMGRSFSHAGVAVPRGCIPCTTLDELSELDAEEAELEENLQRDDLTWDEEVAAVARVAALRERQAKAAGGNAPAVADIAAEVHRAKREGYGDGATPHGVARTRKQLLLAKHLDDPAVKAAKNLDDAFKALQRKEQLGQNAQLAAQIGPVATAASHELFQVDSLEWLATGQIEQFDVICTDPPYGMGADAFGDAGGAGGAVGQHRYADTPEAFKRLMEPFAIRSYVVAKAQAHLYLFCDLDQFHYLRELFYNCGWQVHRTPLIWHKPQGSRWPWPEHGPQRKYELILYAVKGRRPVTGCYPDLVSYPVDANLGHQAQKPVALMLDLLRRSVRPGDRVFDPFAGSGPVLPAAHELRCSATLLERDPASFGICIRRLETIKQQAEQEQ